MLLLAAKTLLDIRSIGPPEDIFGKVDTQEVNTQESYSNSLKQSNFLNKIYFGKPNHWQNWRNYIGIRVLSLTGMAIIKNCHLK